MDSLDFLRNEPTRNLRSTADFKPARESAIDKLFSTLRAYVIAAVIGLMGGCVYTLALRLILFNDESQTLSDALFYPPLIISPLAAVGGIYLFRWKRAKCRTEPGGIDSSGEPVESFAQQTSLDGARSVPQTSELPRATTTLESLRTMVADCSRSAAQRRRTPALEGSIVRRQIAWIALITVLFICGGFFLYWQEQKSAWEAEQAEIQALLKIQGLSFTWDQVHHPEWLYGKYGRRVVGVTYDRLRLVSGVGWDRRSIAFELDGSIAPVHLEKRTELSHDEVLEIGRRFQYVDEKSVYDADSFGARPRSWP